ncbi:HAUS augmin-like complex subunit 6 isoform X1 [Oryzias latipes]|uniref:HAUS augmin-like complex subunit 6 isoform X1 n=1 Tax=Oryzias latipes TaxID=8090 RepID=UPI000CE23E11|nr:HAUS augmin-like complex subunit 6 isoform X1 [Oryzias latipes]
MANAALMQKKNGQLLWFSLLGLGFQPESAASFVAGKANVKHLNMGPNMFKTPNKEAFYIVTHFLLEKLNPTRFHDAYRHCWPVLNQKADAEFRKITCGWLREIWDETANAGSKVVASLFLSPGGPKFTNLMLHLAHHVMLQEMKAFTTDDCWVPEAAAAPATSLDTAVKRFCLIRRHFIKAAVDQDRFLHDYQKQAQVIVKSIKEIKAEGATYYEPHDSTHDEAVLAEKTRKVRSLWSDIEGMLLTIKEEQSAVESVLNGDVDRHVLDGTNQTLRIPRCLLEKVEKLPQQMTSGNVYEGGKLNLLCVVELMNHALRSLREERCQVSAASKPQISAQQLQEKCRHMTHVLQDLCLIRQKISKEEIPQLRFAIKELEADWDRRWMDTLEGTPLMSFLNNDPTLGFLSPMAPLSFEPAAESAYSSSVFSQFPAKLVGEHSRVTFSLFEEHQHDKPPERESQEPVNPGVYTPISTSNGTAESSESPSPRPPRRKTSLDWLVDTPPSPPQKAASPPIASVKKTALPKAAPVKTQTQILDLECDNLADQLADAVASSGPSEGREKGLDFEALLKALSKDPFATKKQLPRTPESLINDVKSSWRRAVQEDNAKKNCPAAKLNDSPVGGVGPPGDTRSTKSPPQTVTSNAGPSMEIRDAPSVCQQGVSFQGNVSWDTIAEALDSPSGTGSSAVQFSLEHETLPEIPSLDSLGLDEDYDGVDLKCEEDEEPLITLPQIGSKPFISRPLDQSQRANSEGAKTTECLMGDFSLDRDWLMGADPSEEKPKVFSLDLDSLETPSPAKEYDLPKLISFSPINDMNF